MAEWFDEIPIDVPIHRKWWQFWRPHVVGHAVEMYRIGSCLRPEIELGFALARGEIVTWDEGLFVSSVHEAFAKGPRS